MKFYKNEKNRYYLCGNELTSEEIKDGYISYATLSKCFNHVLCNRIAEVNDYAFDYAELISGNIYDDEEEETYKTIFQYYIVSDNAVDLLTEANEIVYYYEYLDVYVWCITHFGTAWNGVSTELKIEFVEVE